MNSLANQSTLDLFRRVTDQRSSQEVAEALGLNRNTVERWKSTKNVPWQYHGDFLRILGHDGIVNITGDGLRDKDQFYTRPEVALQCYHTLLKQTAKLDINISKHIFIEPAVGSGSFWQHLPRTRRIGIDIAPQKNIRNETIIGDYLRWLPMEQKKFVVIGNPPFGLRGHLALQFINHSAGFADLVAFILPQLFDSDGKGVPGKRVDSKLKLLWSEKLPEDGFVTPSGSLMKISTVFQIWSGISHDKILLPSSKSCSSYIKIYSLSDGGTSETTRNKNMIDKCDIYLPSTCFRGMQVYYSFEDLPNRRGYGIKILREFGKVKQILCSADWNEVAFISTNGAQNLRTSLIQKVLVDAGIAD